MVEFRDVRDWLERAREMGELAVVNQAETKYEPGPVSQINARNYGPAILYQSMKGYKQNYRLLTNLMCNVRTINLTFGLPIDSTLKETVENLRTRIGKWTAEAKDFPPEVVESAPILENVEEGERIDLTEFPTPWWHEPDGGPYIGTADAIITRDPDTDHINVGTYRSQLYGSRLVGLHIVAGKHGYVHREKYWERGERCPVVMVFGPDPLLYAISSLDIPEDVCELNYVGAIREERVPVVIGRKTGLPIPAWAEIAVEGFADKSVLRDEGPFGEWTGYYAGGRREKPAVEVVALYYRNDPILCGAPPGKGTYSDQGFWLCVCRSAILYNEIARAGVPGLRGVWLPEYGGGRMMQVISLKQLYGGHATQAGHVAAQTYAGAYLGRFTIVVDDDIDPYDMDDVMWAVCTRARPTDIDIIKSAWSGLADPTIRRPAESLTSSRAIIYAVKPYEWQNEYPPVNLASERARREAFNRLKEVFGDRWSTI